MWNKDYLLKKRSQFKKALKNCYDIEKANKLNEALYSVEYIMDLIYGDSKDTIVRETFKEKIDNEKYYRQHYEILFPYISKFSDNFTNDELFSYHNLRQRSSDREKILGMTCEFYNTLDKRFSKPFNRIFEKRDQWVKYVDSIAGNYPCYTLPIYHSNVILMLLTRTNSIEDFRSAVHEYGHAIDVSYNQSNIENLERLPFSELVSKFMELIDSIYMEDKGYSPAELLFSNINDFTQNLESAIVINEKNNIIDMVDRNKIYSAKQAVKYLKNDVQMKDFGIDQVLNETMGAHLPYVVSYLLAIELYLIYLEDKNEALNTVYSFIRLKDYSVSDYLDFFKKSGVEMGKNTDAYVKLIKNKKDAINNGRYFSN